MKRFKEQAAAHLAPVARTGHLAYFVGVFVEGHGFYVYAALGLAITEAILWVLGHGEG